MYLSIVQILHELMANLLQRGNLSEGGFISIGELLDLLLKLLLGLLDLVKLGKTLAFEAGLPLLDLSVLLADLTEKLLLAFLFLIELLAKAVVLVLKVLDLSGESLALTKCSELVGYTTVVTESPRQGCDESHQAGWRTVPSDGGDC